MFSSNLIFPLKIRNSERKNSLGGYLAEETYKLTFTFNELDSILGNFQYRFFYFVNELESDFFVYKVKLSQYIDYKFHQDKFDLYLLKNIKSEVVITNFFGKNKTHLSYTPYGEIIEFQGKSIDEFVVFQGSSIEIKEKLYYQDFYPFAIKVSLIGAIERVFNLPIILNIKAYLA